jgi:hypothetical protein
VRDLQTYLSPESEHMLDWFHITMRLTVMGQMIKGMTAELKPYTKCLETTTVLADMEKHLESVKWNLWHGNVLHGDKTRNGILRTLSNLLVQPISQL